MNYVACCVVTIVDRLPARRSGMLAAERAGRREAMRGDERRGAMLAPPNTTICELDSLWDGNDLVVANNDKSVGLSLSVR